MNIRSIGHLLVIDILLIEVSRHTGSAVQINLRTGIDINASSGIAGGKSLNAAVIQYQTAGKVGIGCYCNSSSELSAVTSFEGGGIHILQNDSSGIMNRSASL